MGWVRAHFSEQRLVYGRTEGRLACSTCYYFWKVRFSSPVAFVRTSSLPPSSSQKTPENRVSRTRKWSKLFQFPTPPIWCHISHPSIKSQPSCVGVVVRVWVVGVCVWGRDNLNPRLFSCKLWASTNTSLGWVFPSIRRGDWPAGSK